MTLQQCPDCLHWMREYTTSHRCPSCGRSVPKQVHSYWHGRSTRATLYPNHHGGYISPGPQVIKLLIFIMVMLSAVVVLGLSMTPRMGGVP